MVAAGKTGRAEKEEAGKPSKLSSADQVVVSLEHWREPNFLHRGWGVHESTVSRIVRKVKNALIQAGIFQLPGKATARAGTVANLVIDAMETPIERQGQKRFYSGKRNGIHSKLN